MMMTSMGMEVMVMGMGVVIAGEVMRRVMESTVSMMMNTLTAEKDKADNNKIEAIEPTMLSLTAFPPSSLLSSCASPPST